MKRVSPEIAYMGHFKLTCDRECTENTVQDFTLLKLKNQVGPKVEKILNTLHLLWCSSWIWNLLSKFCNYLLTRQMRDPTRRNVTQSEHIIIKPAVAKWYYTNINRLVSCMCGRQLSFFNKMVKVTGYFNHRINMVARHDSLAQLGSVRLREDELLFRWP